MNEVTSTTTEAVDEFNDPTPANPLHRSFWNLSKELSELHGDSVPSENGTPSSIEFLRKYVSRNMPVIFKNAVSHWPALNKWTDEYLGSKLQEDKLTVAVTPDGFADAVVDDFFMLPEERNMTYDEFVDGLNDPNDHSVYYIQKQCDNLIEEFSCLVNDIDHHIPWATEALGRRPDAANIWIGNSESVTSMHKDHYENLFVVVRGSKQFILHPPTDVPWIPYNTYPVGRYCFEDGRFVVHPLNEKKKWIPINPNFPDFRRYPLYRHATKYVCVVQPGDVFYLPSMWYHHVFQSDGCIAVNFWYDMDFDIKYCYFKFLEKLSELHQRITRT